MHERPDELTALQALLDSSRRQAGEHLRRAFGESTSTADDVVRELAGVFEMHLAVVTGAGAPLVAPVDGVLFHGNIWFGLPAASVRSRLVRRDPRASASYTSGSTAFIVHGDAHELDEDSELALKFEGVIRELYVALYGPGWIDWYESQRAVNPDRGFTGWLEPRRFFFKH